MPPVKVDGSAGRDTWDRMPGEKSKVYARFEKYRDLGASRTLTKVAQECGVSYATIVANAHAWAWQDRADAWDRAMERERVIAHREAVADMKRRQVSEAKALQSRAVERLKNMTASELTPRVALAFIVEAAKLERMALGQPTEIVADASAHAGGIDLSKLTQEELANLEGIVTKAQVRPEFPTGGGEAVEEPADDTDSQP